MIIHINNVQAFLFIHWEGGWSARECNHTSIQIQLNPVESMVLICIFVIKKYYNAQFMPAVNESVIFAPVHQLNQHYYRNG